MSFLLIRNSGPYPVLFAFFFKLTLHPTKTQIVYCKDEDRVGNYSHISFDFLGYTFRPRLSKNRREKYFVNFSPAMSDKAAKMIRSKVKQWKWNLRPGDSLEDFARECNAKIRGWIVYYGRYYYSALVKVLQHIDYRLMLWATRLGRASEKLALT